MALITIKHAHIAQPECVETQPHADRENMQAVSACMIICMSLVAAGHHIEGTKRNGRLLSCRLGHTSWQALCSEAVCQCRSLQVSLSTASSTPSHLRGPDSTAEGSYALSEGSSPRAGDASSVASGPTARPFADGIPSAVEATAFKSSPMRRCAAVASCAELEVEVSKDAFCVCFEAFGMQEVSEQILRSCLRSATSWPVCHSTL